MRNLALFGKSGSGKTTIANYLVEKYGFEYCSTGYICRKISKMLFDTEDKSMLNTLTDKIKLIDENVWLHAALKNIKTNNPIVFDSMRFKIDHDYLKEKNFVLLKVSAPLEERIERLKKRNQIFNPRIDGNHTSEIELDSFPFDYEIVNSGHIQEAYIEIDRILQQHEKNDYTPSNK